MKRTTTPLADTGQPVSVSRWSRTATGFTGVAAVTLLVLAAVPYFAGGPAEQPLITLLTFVAMASQWNLLAGFSGLTSFGQNAYIGLGAYGLYLVAAHGVNPFAGIILAALIAAVISLPVSLLVLRLSGGYFAVATLVVAAVFQIVATLSPSVGGTTGVSVPGLAGYDPVLREALIYWATLAVAVISVAGVYLLVRRTFGLDARAVGSDPVAAASAGVRVGRIRRLAYLVAAGGAGAVGALVALQTPVRGADLGLQHPVQRVHAVHGADRRDGHDRGPGARRAGAVRAAGGAVLLRRLVPGDRGRPRGDRHPDRLARAVGPGQRPVRLVPAAGRLPGPSSARMREDRPRG